MLQDIRPSVFNNQFKPRAPKPGDGILVFGRNTVLAKAEEGVLAIPRYPQLDASIEDFLFYIDDVAYYAPKMDCPLDGFEMMSIRSVFTMLPKDVPFAIATGYHIHSWRHYHKFCGVCGALLKPSETERALVCPDCGHTIYPDIHPAVNIAIRNGDRILLAKHQGNRNAFYALIAGFIEVGETAEDTVHREPMEEVGLKVRNIRYYGSQPWGTAGNLQLGFVCDVDGDDTPHIDEREIAEARWFERSEVPTELGTHSITGTMIEAFRRGEI